MKKAWKRIVTFCIVCCMMLSIGGAVLAVDVDVVDESAELEQTEEAMSEPLADEFEVTDETAIPEEIEEPEESADEPQQEIPIAQEQEVTEVEVQATEQETEEQPFLDVPIRTQSTAVSSNKTLKILAIGNSFTEDTMKFVYPIVKSAGYSVTVGVLWSSSADLQDHVVYFENKSPAYIYDKTSKDTNDKMVSKKGVSVQKALKDEDWDLVFLQQQSYKNGVPSSFTSSSGESYMKTLVDYIRDHAAKKSLSTAWLMGWAYAEDYDNAQYSQLFDGKQATMYQAIVDTMRHIIWPTGLFETIIPVGTAVQNARSSYVGDHLNRDGRHLTYSLGRYTAGLAVAAAIGVDVNKVTYCPADSVSVSGLHLPMLRQAVKKAVANPYKVSKSTYKKLPTPKQPKISSAKNMSYGVKLEWAQVTGASKYWIYRKVKGSSKWTKLGETIAGTSSTCFFRDKRAVNGKRYSYRITAHFDSFFDNTKTKNSVAVLSIDVPKSVKVSAAAKQLTVSWGKNSIADRYQVRYSTSKSMKNPKMVTVGKSTVRQTITKLKAKKKYYVQVRGSSVSSGKRYYSAWSGVISKKTK